MAEKICIDQLGRKVSIPDKPLRIVSLVPSITDFLHYLNFEKEVIGITKFCIHPNEWFKTKTRIGGTKSLNIEKILALNPDLIIGNKEENVENEIKALSNHFPVWMSDVNSFDDAIEMIKKLGNVLNRQNECKSLIHSINDSFQNLKNIGQQKSVLYFIWHNPDYLAGNFTFIDSILNTLGFVNDCKMNRYPDMNDISIDSPDYIFLSSEPFPFSSKHIEYFKDKFPTSKVVLVNGEMFSWYGSYMLKLPSYIENELINKL